MLSFLRIKLKPLQKVLAYPFILLRINPNYVSLLGLVFALIGAYFVFLQNWFFALIFFLLAPLMDFVDGEVARSLKLKSNWGNYFETMIDKFVDFIVLGSFVFVPTLEIPAVLALGFSMLSSYAKPRVALIIITDNHDWPAIGEHADKLFIIIFGLFLSSIGINSILGINTLFISLLAVALISFIGVLQRMIYAKKLILEAEKKGNLLPYIKNNKER